MKNAHWIFFLFSLPAFLYCDKSKHGHSEPAGAVQIKETVIARGLSFPWEILWGPDGHIWMTERGGKVSRLDPATGKVTTLLTIGEVVSNGEGGLLGMALHPDFSVTPQVFVVYDYKNGNDYRGKVVRYNYKEGILSGPVTIIDNIHAAGIHNGSRLLIVSGKLFITTGDASDQSRPQDTGALNGKILRLNLDGSIPADNPVPGNPYWSYGHRNPQGLVYANNRLYSAEHGPNSDDEINIIEKGRNYGWPTVAGFCTTHAEKKFCTANKVVSPIEAWSPTLATCGLDYYNNDLIPQWKNSLLLATLKDASLYQLKLGNDNSSIANTNRYLSGSYGRLRDICIAPNGRVYVCTSNGNDDKIIELRKK